MLVAFLRPLFVTVAWQLGFWETLVTCGLNVYLWAQNVEHSVKISFSQAFRVLFTHA